MADKKNSDVTIKTNDNYMDIDYWCNTLNTSAAVFEAIKAANRWRAGKQVTEVQYKEACNAFLTGAQDGKGDKYKYVR